MHGQLTVRDTSRSQHVPACNTHGQLTVRDTGRSQHVPACNTHGQLTVRDTSRSQHVPACNTHGQLTEHDTSLERLQNSAVVWNTTRNLTANCICVENLQDTITTLLEMATMISLQV